MNLRFPGGLCAMALAMCLVTDAATAQTLRFDTNVGTFDMVLNPTGNPFLQDHVDNIMQYVEAGSYERTVINRAATNFVLQMGGFQAHTLELPASFNEFPPVNSFGTVTVDEDGDGEVDFDLGGLSNTRGTVSLALQTNAPNSGNSSFFINLNDSNSFLDESAFVPFAEIIDMETVDLIMSLPQANLDPSGQNLGAINIPLASENRLVIIESVFLVDSPEVLMAPVGGDDDDSSSEEEPQIPGTGTGNQPSPSDPSSEVTVPEPSTLLTALGSLALLGGMRRPRGV